MRVLGGADEAQHRLADQRLDAGVGRRVGQDDGRAGDGRQEQEDLRADELEGKE